MITLAHFLRAHRDPILHEWQERTRALPSARGLDNAEQRDHIPQLLDALATAIEQHDASSRSLRGTPEQHAEHRWAQDYDLREIVAEYRVLRRVIMDRYASQARELDAAARARLPPLTTLGENIDHAIEDAVDHFMIQRDRTREYFVSMLSHDLREPLNVIALNAEMLSMQAAGSDAPALARIVSNAARMKRLIDDMLDVTRSRLGGGLPIAPSPVDLRTVLDKLIDGLRSVHPGREIRVETEGDCSGDWDPLRIGQAVSNLVSNAIAHGADPIDVHARGDGDHVTLDVKNRGEVPADLRDRLFEPFVSGAASTGSGLG
ncbi:MAG TPA: HAMP domain-containing sensor histidine kinase, partial [Lysobacter sp.]